MTDGTFPTSPTNADDVRKVPSLKVLAAIFIVTAVVSGGLIYVILTAIIEPPDFDEAYNTLVYEQRGDGVRIITEPREVLDFTLTSHTGEPMSISDLRGKFVMMYFGYTGCPDICPMTLMDMQQVREHLGEDAEKLAFVFVSVDPERDTPEMLASYFQRRGIDDFMIGMSGEEITLRRITPDYNLRYQAQEVQENGYYAVDHTTSLFLLDDEGRLTTIYGFGTQPQTIAEHIQEQL